MCVSVRRKITFVSLGSAKNIDIIEYVYIKYSITHMLVFGLAAIPIRNN